MAFDSPKVRQGRAKKKSAAQKLEALKRIRDLAAARSIARDSDRKIAVDCLTTAWISKDLLQKEPYLVGLLHPTYIGMEPLQRTELFLDTYIAVYKEMHAKYFDAAVGPQKQPAVACLAGNSIEDINSLWRARIEADVLGVSYEVYLHTVIKAKIERDKWTHAGLPNQLYRPLDIARVRGRTDADAQRCEATPANGQECPSCFGFPHWNWDAPCATCTFAKKCYEHVQAVRGALIAATGTDDPRSAKKRVDAAHRQRRWYARKKKRPPPEG